MTYLCLSVEFYCNKYTLIYEFIYFTSSSRASS